MTPEQHRRRYVTNLAQLMAGIHRCATDTHPVGECCWTRATMVYDQLRTRASEPETKRRTPEPAA